MSTAEPVPQDAVVLRLERKPLVAKNHSESVAPGRGGLRAWQRDYRHLLRWTDAVVIAQCLAVAQALRFESVAGATLAGHRIDYLVVSLVIAVLWLGTLAMYRSRESRVLGYGLEEYQRVWTATLVVYGGVAVLSYVFKLEIARGYLVLALPLGMVGLAANRWIVRRVMLARRRAQGLNSAVLAIGEADSVGALTQELARHPELGYTVVGVCGPDITQCTNLVVSGAGDVRIYPCGEDVMSAVAASAADVVAITSGYLNASQIRDLSWQLEELEIDLVVALGVLDVSRPRLMIRPVGGLPLIHIDKPRYEGANHFRKRLFDVFFSVAVLLLVTPLLLLVALAIKFEDHGPVFYTAERIGLDGRRFRMLKFRTMAVGADQRLGELSHLDEGNGVLFKIRSDPRVTRVGYFLRRYSIDEIPQFINVLRRDMSVVGPRPPLPSEVSAYDDQMRRRLFVRPGITGLWQISGRSDLSWEDSVRLDLSYVENWSMVGDLVIAAKTVNVVRRGSGAY